MTGVGLVWSVKTLHRSAGAATSKLQKNSLPFDAMMLAWCIGLCTCPIYLAGSSSAVLCAVRPMLLMGSLSLTLFSVLSKCTLSWQVLEQQLHSTVALLHSASFNRPARGDSIPTALQAKCVLEPGRTCHAERTTHMRLVRPLVGFQAIPTAAPKRSWGEDCLS